MGTFCKVTWSKYDEPFFYKQLPLNVNENHFDENLIDNNYKRIFINLHDAGWKVFSLMLTFLCLVMDVVCLSILNLWSRFKGVSSITRSILGFFWGWYWRKMYKGKIGVRLGRLSRNIYLGMYQKEYNTEICFYIEAKDYNSKIKNSAKIQIWGNMFYFYSRHWK